MPHILSLPRPGSLDHAALNCGGKARRRGLLASGNRLAVVDSFDEVVCVSGLNMDHPGLARTRVRPRWAREGQRGSEGGGEEPNFLSTS